MSTTDVLLAAVSFSDTKQAKARVHIEQSQKATQLKKNARGQNEPKVIGLCYTSSDAVLLSVREIWS